MVYFRTDLFDFKCQSDVLTQISRSFFSFILPDRSYFPYLQNNESPVADQLGNEILLRNSENASRAMCHVSH